MATYFTANHAADLTEYSATTGAVSWQPFGGASGGGSLHVNASSAAAYATADLGEDKTTLHLRFRFEIAHQATMTLARGRNAAGDTAWELTSTWETAWSMLLVLFIHDTLGTPHQMIICPPMRNLGAGWVEISITAGSPGQASALFGGDAVLAATNTPPNRATRYIDFGSPSPVLGALAYIDAIIAADAAVGVSGLAVRQLRDPIVDHTRTYSFHEAGGYPTGGKELFSDGDGTPQIMEICSAAMTDFQLFDADGHQLVDVTRHVGVWRHAQPLPAKYVRFSNITHPAYVRCSLLES